MSDVFSKAKRSTIMASVRSCGNRGTELKLIQIFRANRITGWRRNATLPGKPDFIFRHQRLAVFVDGCFWHRCPIHGSEPVSNVEYWIPKLARNRSRDLAVTRKLKSRGWRVLRIWEHDLRKPEKIAKRCRRALRHPLASP